jgi:hypothetical protein
VLINDALVALVGRPTYVAMRPTGILLKCSNQLSVLKLGVGRKDGVARPYKWQPMFADLVATDWMVFSPEQLQEMRAKARAQAEQEGPHDE